MVTNFSRLLVVPIVEASRAAEVLLGPYTPEEHARRGLIVREGRLNRAYDGSVRLLERADPDGKKKRARPVEVEGTGPIAVSPLNSAPPRELDESASTGGRASKRPAEGSPERVDLSGSDSSGSSSDSPSGSVVREVAATVAGHTSSDVRRAVGCFAVA